MAQIADFRFYSALQDESRRIEDEQADILEQNQQAGLGNTIGSILGGLAGFALTGGNPIGAAAGARLVGEAGEQIAGGYEGGSIQQGKFFREDVAMQNRQFDQARRQMNQAQWTDSLMKGLTAYAAGGMGDFSGSPLDEFLTENTGLGFEIFGQQTGGF